MDDQNGSTETDDDSKISDKIRTIKRKPGRPSSIVKRDAIPLRGVLNMPDNRNHALEFLYDKPMIIKKLWTSFRTMAIESVQIIFRKNEVLLWGVDHLQKSRMLTRFNTAKLNQYYCEKELDIGISDKSMEKITSTIDKTYESICFISRHGDTQKNIRTILKNELEIDEQHIVDLYGSYQKMNNIAEFLDDDYTIKFTLPCKYFKKMIADIKVFSDQITIKQDGVKYPLIFEYNDRDKHIKSENIAKNNKRINLVSKLKDDDTFRTNFTIDYVKPFSSSLIAENITVYADENKDIMFICNINEAIEMRVITSTVKPRK